MRSDGVVELRQLAGTRDYRVTVTFTSNTDPTQIYRVTVKVKDPATAGGAPTIKAKVRGGAGWHAQHKHHGEHEGEH